MKFQIRYHFSDENLSMDNYLLSRMHEDSEYWVSLSTVANLTKIRALTDDEKLVLQAIENIIDEEPGFIMLNENKNKIKRCNYTPALPSQHKDLRRTVFIYGIPSNVDKQALKKICSQYGTVKQLNKSKTSNKKKQKYVLFFSH